PSAEASGTASTRSVYVTFTLMIGAAVGPAMMGLVSDKIGPINTSIICMSLTTTLIFVFWYPWPFREYWTFILFGFVFGFFSCVYLVTYSIKMAKLFGPEKFAGMAGLFIVSCGVGILVGTPLEST